MYSYSRRVSPAQEGSRAEACFRGDFLACLEDTPFTASFTTETYPLHVKYCTVVRTPDTSTAYSGTDKDRFPAISARSRTCSSQVDAAVGQI